MLVAVWDTYVNKKDNTIMHFYIIVSSHIRDTTIIFGYGEQYLITKQQQGQTLGSRECKLCHTEKLHPKWEPEILEKGYLIIEIRNCND